MVMNWRTGIPSRLVFFRTHEDTQSPKQLSLLCSKHSTASAGPLTHLLCLLQPLQDNPQDVPNLTLDCLRFLSAQSRFQYIIPIILNIYFHKLLLVALVLFGGVHRIIGLFCEPIFSPVCRPACIVGRDIWLQCLGRIKSY